MENKSNEKCWFFRWFLILVVSKYSLDAFALLELLTQLIITPVINKFGHENFKLTYRFCSKDLLKFLTFEKSRICVKIDQHMSHEINSKGNYYCKHLGAACDFVITGIDSRKVISYIKTINFDSIYYYGKDKPIHISWSSTYRRKIWEFTPQNTPKPCSNYYCVN